MLMGIRVTPAGEAEGVVVNVPKSTLAGMREQIGCRVVDVVRLGHGVDGWIDDDGFYTQEPNQVATVMATMLGRDTRASVLHGPVLFLSVDEADGATRSLSPDQHARVLLYANLAKDGLTRAEALIAATRA